jgi:hypothetical protein
MDAPKTKHELMIIALQQRIGEITSQYEGTIASLRADLTQMLAVNDIVNQTQDERREEITSA